MELHPCSLGVTTVCLVYTPPNEVPQLCSLSCSQAALSLLFWLSSQWQKYNYIILSGDIPFPDPVNEEQKKKKKKSNKVKIKENNASTEIHPERYTFSRWEKVTNRRRPGPPPDFVTRSEKMYESIKSHAPKWTSGDLELVSSFSILWILRRKNWPPQLLLRSPNLGKYGQIW